MSFGCFDSDDAIAAYLDVCGASLKCLMLNNVIQVFMQIFT